MIKSILAAAIAVIFATFTLSAQARDVGGVQLSETMQTDSGKLILNGGGIRTKTFFDIYVAGLYLTKENHNFKQIIDADEPMAINITITSGLVTSERFIEACEAGFQRSTNGNMAPLKDKIDLVYTAFRQKFSKGDVFNIVYEPNKGTSFYKNKNFIATQEGLDLKKALFGIWIIDKPSHKNEKLRKGMLGIAE
ncbi:hypothetical protein A9Q81_09145 [Gammaproteobacteria bacterium 42_54_T18]|nr:hypothetical protein A9Q81_09145 [Gammaproteobacteria bacterium 42_54_T18]